MTDEHRDNLELWNQVCTSNPAFVKSGDNGRHKFSEIDAQHQLQNATRLWGPYGVHWGMEDMKFQHISVGQSTALVLECVFFWPGPNGERHYFEMANDLKFTPGIDCYKRLMTNTRSKALSWLGFNADIFLGQFDDPQYVESLKTHDTVRNLKELIAHCPSIAQMSQVMFSLKAAVRKKQLHLEDIAGVMDTMAERTKAMINPDTWADDSHYLVQLLSIVTNKSPRQLEPLTTRLHENPGAATVLLEDCTTEESWNVAITKCIETIEPKDAEA